MCTCSGRMGCGCVGCIGVRVLAVVGSLQWLGGLPCLALDDDCSTPLSPPPFPACQFTALASQLSMSSIFETCMHAPCTNPFLGSPGSTTDSFLVGIQPYSMANGNAWRCLTNCLQCFCPSLEMALQISTCPDCEGAGERATPCNTCGGDGRVRRTKKINLNVPPGVDNGSRLRVRGEGSAGRKGGQSCLPAHTAVALFCCC